MMIQGQLGEPQRPRTFLPWESFTSEAQADSGLLGNKSIQEASTRGGSAFGLGRYGVGAYGGGQVNVVREVNHTESDEMAWLVENAQELVRHRGEWLLIQGRTLLAHSADFAAVRAAIRERQILSPFIYYVPTEEESNSVTI
jgi:hypothetical protein